MGQKSAFCQAQICETALDRAADLLNSDLGLGFSQFNELLLQLGYDRVCHDFFQYIVDGTIEHDGDCLKTIDGFAAGVNRFRKLSLLRFGNIKYGFKTLANDVEALSESILVPIDPRKFEGRHKPAMDILPIPGTETYYLGYLIGAQIDGRLKVNPNDPVALADQAKRIAIIQKGIHNHEVYLCFDHMDVYVATSMREAHEYAMVNQWTRDIFENPVVSDLKVRWFDPTQAYCLDRIDKGIAEALMLKRAFCTLYFAQESDTLGKDSELASTLAQGKPVIAYIPRGGRAYAENLRNMLRQINPSGDMRQLLLHQLRLFQSGLAWEDAEIRQWLDDPSSANEETVFDKLCAVTESQYDKRADTLKHQHPLGIQVHLETGVANGVLVVRDLADCAKIVRRVMLNELEFNISEKNVGGNKYVLLTESISNSVFRVMTGDAKLTNSFWNFYLN